MPKSVATKKTEGGENNPKRSRRVSRRQEGSSEDAPPGGDAQNAAPGGDSPEGNSEDATTLSPRRSKRKRNAAKDDDNFSSRPKEVSEKRTSSKKSKGEKKDDTSVDTPGAAVGADPPKSPPRGNTNVADDAEVWRTSPRKPTTTSATSNDDSDDDEESELRPYGPSFGFKLRFMGVSKNIQQVRFSQEEDLLRSRVQVSDREQFEWCLSMKSTERRVRHDRLPSHSTAASGYIGCLSSTLSRSSFVVPGHVKKKSRYPQDPKEFRLFFADAQMPNEWLKPPTKELLRKIMRVRPNT